MSIMARQRRYAKGERPMCRECGKNVCKIKGYSPIDREPYYKNKCHVCLKGFNSKQKPYADAVKRKHDTMTCEQCGFKALHVCQLDIDHIDGNHDNNDPSNHQILCANCHRLKTKQNKDGWYGNN